MLASRRGAPRPLCNASFRMDATEFRLDHWWDKVAVGGEADGALKYSSDQGRPRALWEEKLRQEWFEEHLQIPFLRYIDQEVRLAPDGLYARFVRKTEFRASGLWTPPPGLEIFQRPVPGSRGPTRWLLRRDDR